MFDAGRVEPHARRVCSPFFKFQRPLSLLESNLASVGVLLPIAVSASGSFESGTTLGMMR